MRKFRSLPAVFTLLAGFVASVIMIMRRYSLDDFIWILVCTMAGFYVVSLIACIFLNKFFVDADSDRLEELDSTEDLDIDNSESDEGM